MDEQPERDLRIFTVSDVCRETGMTKTMVTRLLKSGRLESLPREKGEMFLIPARSLEVLLGHE